ncbi:MAG: hypothetical protein MMC23_004993 [Stictis urceolatum]|nr:hypothetical protein [Stictis urceolata]
MPYRILLTTHHITSQAKLSALTKAAHAHNVSCLLKVGAHPPGIMLCEGDTADVRAWHAVVKRLRYKDYSYKGGQEVPTRDVMRGKVGLKQVGSSKEMGELMGEEARGWWRGRMGWK